MALNEIYEIITILGAILGFISALIAGLKYFWKRHNATLDDRINYCINKNIEPIEKIGGNHEERIKSLEDRFRDFKDFFMGAKKST